MLSKTTLCWVFLYETKKKEEKKDFGELKETDNNFAVFFSFFFERCHLNIDRKDSFFSHYLDSFFYQSVLCFINHVSRTINKYMHITK